VTSTDGGAPPPARVEAGLRRALGGRSGTSRRRPYERYSAGVATFDDVALIAREMPDVTEGKSYGNRAWSVAGKVFAWERPFSKADLKRFGERTPPDGPILAVRVDDLSEKAAVLASASDAFFTIPHFDGYSAVLVHLSSVSRPALREAVIDGWLACAPPELADEYLKR
jgi:hypothetical protein